MLAETLKNYISSNININAMASQLPRVKRDFSYPTNEKAANSAGSDPNLLGYVIFLNW